MQTINCKGRLIRLDIPRVMGIINVTPDSFYDGGTTTTETLIVKQASQMLEEGATFLDIGGYSSKPGATHISENEEIDRVIPAIKSILNEFPEALISIDTFRSEVAKAAVQAGTCMVNDISGGQLDHRMLDTVAELQVPYILMHMRGNPQNMKTQVDYKDVTKEVLLYFSQQLAAARKAGINDVIIDPGFGFAKTTEQSFELLSNVVLLQQIDIPILVGVSRKSMIYKTLDITTTQALNGTTVLNTIALEKGAAILRVHDVKEAMQAIQLTQMLKRDIT